MKNHLQELSHKRFNILTGEWVLVSPHRAKRPWQGQVEELNEDIRPSYDPNCYLCPGNQRANGQKNPIYDAVFVFLNDFAALHKDSKDFSLNDGLLMAKSEQGICKVVCFSPNHSKSLAQMETIAIAKVIKTWQKQYSELGALENINYVQIFENKGAIMGCSNPHPHGQIWSQSTLPNEVLKKDIQQFNYHKRTHQILLLDYLKQELNEKERMVFENESFAVLVPFWAVWPFETIIIPKESQNTIVQMSNSDIGYFAEAISVLTKIYDTLFICSFPYSSGIHQAPTNGKKNNYWQWHMSFYPPLLRSATVKKFMVGYEMFGSPQRDITSEKAAKLLRNLVEEI